MRSYRHRRTGRTARRLCHLAGDCAREEAAPCPTYFARYGRAEGVGDATPLVGVAQQMTGLLRPPPGPAGELRVALVTELNRLPAEVHVAVSGGIDCWVLAVLTKRIGRRVTAWYLESRVLGYCEREAAEIMSGAAGIPMEAIVCGVTDFHDRLPTFVAATESPVYNLHPVSKILLAEGLARQGIRSVLSGDGADQVFRWDLDCDLLPLTLECFAHSGIELVAPFLSDGVKASVPRPYADKEPLRVLAETLGVPNAPKRPARFPCDSQSVLTRSTQILFEQLGVPLPCAALQA